MDQLIKRAEELGIQVITDRLLGIFIRTPDHLYKFTPLHRDDAVQFLTKLTGDQHERKNTVQTSSNRT